MGLTELAAIAFTIMTLGVVGFQLALALGAPWGAYAMGGAFPGRYPVRMRVAAVVQVVILAVIALAVLSAAGVVTAPWGMTPTWVIWVVAALLGVGLVLNLVTPSAGERRIWAPVVAVMLACSIVVVVVG